jgi:DNA-binding transcriptional ArsR family regulator
MTGTRYFITVNTYVLAKNKLSILHGAILEHLNSVCTSVSESMEKYRETDENGTVWTKVDYTYIEKYIPALDLSARSIRRKVEDLRDAGFLELKKLKNNVMYVRVTEKVQEMYYIDGLKTEKEVGTKGLDILSSSTDLSLTKSANTPARDSNTSSRDTRTRNNNNQDNAGTPARGSGALASVSVSGSGESSSDQEVQKIFESYRDNIHNARLTGSAKKKIQTRLKEYTAEELLRAIENFAGSEWWMEHNSHRGLKWFFMTEDRIEQFLNITSTGRRPAQTGDSWLPSETEWQSYRRII